MCKHACNSGCEEPQTCPLGPETDTKEIGATDIQKHTHSMLPGPDDSTPEGPKPPGYCSATAAMITGWKERRSPHEGQQPTTNQRTIS
ncbi:hypothetical protein ATANTOWER_028174 [Ataeniobius toweri]|uniref:Uncharacterized protein n=1 Tax=Ataeniobius toweri TaxID=208326 RepID=A0ABU7C3V5_9TELE|nr:hypothetical protein [Ataeniobius toweri]